MACGEMMTTIPSTRRAAFLKQKFGEKFEKTKMAEDTQLFIRTAVLKSNCFHGRHTNTQRKETKMGLENERKKNFSFRLLFAGRRRRIDDETFCSSRTTFALDP
jgi:hypothetical protein